MPDGPGRQSLLLRRLPQNVDAEAIVLGAILVDPETWTHLPPELSPHHFIRDEHRAAFSAIRAARAVGGSGDAICLASWFAANSEIFGGDGSALLTHLVGCAAAGPKSAGEYARVVIEEARRRQLIELAEDVMAAAYNAQPEEDAAAIAAAAVRELEAVAAAGSASQRFRGEDFASIDAENATPSLVAGLLGEGALSGAIGPEKSAKSFFALDLALHVAAGIPWRGRAVKRGQVVYFALEGGSSMRKRVVAWRLQSRTNPEQVAFRLVTGPVDLRGAGDLPSLIAAVKDAARASDLPAALVVVDTLSRALVGGSDNDPADMAAFVANCDRVRQATGAHVLVVHHTGKDQARGSRGSSVFPAAVDTLIEVATDPATRIRTATVKLQRDGIEGDTLPFILDIVELKPGPDGQPETTCIVRHLDGSQAPRSPRKVSGHNKIALTALQNALADAGEVPPPSSHIPGHVPCARIEIWREYFYKVCPADGEPPEKQREALKKAFQRVRKDLQAYGHVAVWDPWAWIVPLPRDIGT